MHMTKWTEFAKESPPEGNGGIYVTDGTRVSFVQRKEQAATEAERWILAEPEAVPLSLTPQVAAPTHWAMAIPGLPTVKEKDMPEVFAGGPPVPEVDPETIKAPVQRTKTEAQQVAEQALEKIARTPETKPDNKAAKAG
jgi:hypothetical protein